MIGPLGICRNGELQEKSGKAAQPIGDCRPDETGDTIWLIVWITGDPCISGDIGLQNKAKLEIGGRDVGGVFARVRVRVLVRVHVHPSEQRAGRTR